jgi:thioredoxin-like negative regulator of GroEL
VSGPDRRLRLAVADLDRLLGRDDAGPIEADRVGERWQLVRNGAPLDSIADWATFEDLFALLVTRAGSLGAKGLITRTPGVAGIDASAPSIRRAHLADRAWSEDGPNLTTLQSAVSALADLSSLVPDRVGVADPLLARALAAAALCEAVAPGTVGADIALIANALGYRASAWARTERLDVSDPVRAFIRNEHATLRGLAERPGATRRAKQLHLITLAATRDVAGWERWLARAFPEDSDWALLATGMALRDFGTNATLGAAITGRLAEELGLFEAREAAAASSGIGSLAGAMDEFEARLEGMKSAADGAFLDRAVLAAYYRDAWYSNLYLSGEHLRVSLASIPATLTFAERLGDGGAPHSAEFRTCFRHVAMLDTENEDVGQLAADLKNVTHFSGAIRFRALREFLERSNPLEFARYMAVVRMAESLDQRPVYRDALGWMMLRAGIDIALAETYLEHAVAESAPRGGSRGWWTGFQGDDEGLLRAIAEPGATPGDLRHLLEQYAALDGTPADSVDARWREAIARHPADWNLTAGLAKRLEDRGAVAAARALIRNWRGVQRPDGFDDIFSRTALARCMNAEGRATDALSVIIPAARSMQYRAMETCARILDGLGRTREADSVAAAAYARYPQSPDAAVLLAGRLWKRRSNAEAAALLAGVHLRLTQAQWRSSVWPSFHEAFHGDRRAAAAAIAAMGVSGLQWWVPGTLLRDGPPTEADAWVAHTLAGDIRSTGHDEIARVIVVFESMRHAAGEARAEKWFQRQMGSMSSRDDALGYMAAYEANHPDALWLMPPDRGSTRQTEFLWLLRASDVVRHGTQGERRGAVEEWFASPGETRYQVFGRFVLGLASEAEALEQATDRRGQCEAYYYIGLHHQLAGRYREAATWYARSYGTRDRLSGEYRWSQQQLLEWGSQNLSLDALARRDARRREAGTPHRI